MPDNDLSFGSAGPDADIVQELLAQLGASVETSRPTPPRAPSIVQRIAGGLGDALSAKGAVLGGGQAPVEGAFARGQIREQEQFRTASSQFAKRKADLDSEILRLKTKIELDEQERNRRETFELQKIDRQDELVKSRQKEDDERDATIAMDVWKRNKIFELSRDVAEAGISESIIPNRAPSSFTLAEIIDFSLSIKEATTGKATTAADRIKAQKAAAKEAAPGMVPSRVTFSGKDGQPNVIFARDPLQFLAQSDRTLALNAGIPIFDNESNPRSAKEILGDIATVKKTDLDAKRAVRDARLAVLAKRSGIPRGTVGMKLTEHITMLQNAEILLGLLTGHPSEAPGGPAAGRLPAGIRHALTDRFISADAGARSREVTERMQNMFNVVAKIRSGAAVTLPEEIRLAPELALITDFKKDQVSKIRRSIEFEKRFIRNLQKTFKITDSDIEFLSEELLGATFISTETEAGDITIFGGDTGE